MTSSFVFSLWLAFSAGLALHVLKRAGMAVRSPANPIASRRQYVRQYWDLLLVRAVLCGGLFWTAQMHPQLLSQVVRLLGVMTSSEIRFDPATALAFGYFADSILDWLASRVPRFARELPPLSFPPPKAQ